MSPRKSAPEPAPEPESLPTPDIKQRLRGDSIEPLVYAWDQEARRLARKLKFHGRKLAAGPLLSALVAWFLEQPEPERDEIARQGLALYEGMTCPKRKKKEGGNPGSKQFTSDPVFRGGHSQGKLGIPIPGSVDRGPKRRADQHGTRAEVVD